jgi:hypothetical protein
MQTHRIPRNYLVYGKGEEGSIGGTREQANQDRRNS